MSTLFNLIVQLLHMVCRISGLSYVEINILLYTFFIPATWWTIVWQYTRKWSWLWILHLGIPALYYFEKERLSNVSNQFYTANTDALSYLGGGSDTGYIQISILIGILIPTIIYLVLWLAPKRLLPKIYIGLMLGNLAWYSWVIIRFAV